MNSKSRETKPPRFQSDVGLRTPLRKATADGADISREEIAFLAEGLAYGPRALRASTHKVTQRHNLGPRGAWIISVIFQGITFPLQLAAIFGVGRSLITAELARLTEAGLIDSRPSPNDRRKTELTLTPLGEAAALEVRGEFAAIVARRLSGFDAAEVRLASEVLRALSFDEDEGVED